MTSIIAKHYGSGPWLRWKFTCPKHPIFHEVSADAMVQHLTTGHRLGLVKARAAVEQARGRNA